jgi:hypothetical protein
MQFGDDLDSVRTTYLALNSQLVSELPLLIQVNLKLYYICFPTFRLSISVPLFASHSFHPVNLNMDVAHCDFKFLFFVGFFFAQIFIIHSVPQWLL